jgi:hypothetical protein
MTRTRVAAVLALMIALVSPWAAAALRAAQAAQNPPSPPAAPPVAPALVARATAAVDALAAGAFGAVASQFSTQMKAALPEEKLRGAWDSVQTTAGAFVRRTGVTTQARGEISAVLVACDFERAKVEVIIVFDAAGAIGGLQMRPAPAAAPPYTAPEYAVASSYTERDVTVGAGEWALPGTLTLPNGAGPHPAVVLVHGSGPNDRDETFGPNKTFKDLALGLGSRGVAVLRYDKRTKVHAAKVASLKQFTVKEETIDDALAAVARLRQTPGIDSRRIYVLGHSLGGMVAPRIAAADPALAGIIAMAGAVRSLDQSIVDQMTYLANADGTVTEAEQRALDDARKTSESVKTLTPADAAAGKGLSGAPASYWLDLRGYNPPAHAATLKTRILVLQGARDYQVTVEDFDKWKAALGARPTAEFRLYPSLNHLFLAGDGKSLPAEYSRPGHVPVEVITDIAAWIRK